MLDERFEEQARQISGLTQRLNDFSRAKQVVSDTQYKLKTAWWRLDLHNTSSTYTAGTDWDTHFDGPRSTSLLKSLRLPTLDGSVEIGNIDPTGGDDLGRRIRIAFDSAQQINGVPFWIRGDFGRIQVKINGDYTEYTSNQQIAFKSVVGHNFIQVIANRVTDSLRIFTSILDQQGVTFRDPDEEDATFNPLSVIGGTGAGGGQGGSNGLAVGIAESGGSS